MRFLHTADWHLGQSLLNRSRAEEQARALDWLAREAVRREVDGLVVAGDIFDVASPAEDARRMYHDFLARLAAGPLAWIVIVAGNHDSPRMLANVTSLARLHDIHVVARPASDCRDDVIELHARGSREPAALLAAIPFLHDGFVRRSARAQAVAEAAEALTAGIHGHFDALAEACAARDCSLPLLATGHLYATGALAREGQDNIYVGNVRNLSAARLPEAFDYVALGHIHRPQPLRGAEHVRYSGSLIPLDFAESADDKGVWCVRVTPGQAAEVEWVGYAGARRLKQLRGSFADVCAQVEAFGQRHGDDELRPWLAVALTDGSGDERRRRTLRDLAAEHALEILKIERQRGSVSATTPAPPVPEGLDDVGVDEIFARRCRAAEVAEDDLARLAPLFAQVLAEVEAGQVEPVE